VLAQQLQVPITESAQEDKYIHSTEINKNMRKLNYIIIQFHSIHLFTCLTTAKYGQLQPSTKTTVQVNIKKTNENIIKVQ
jgi:hypothetical protein